jgi:ferrous iron transport protein B
MTLKIALAGNPNCGKTTLFNALTGSAQYVGNWPGVTVEKKEGRLKGHKDVVIQDLPGIYSLSPYTLEERISFTYLVNDHPDAIINIVDATNLERNLYLTTQLAELGTPMVVALNMIDAVRRSGSQIDKKRLAESLGCIVVEMSALKGEGIMEAAEAAIKAAEERKGIEPLHCFDGAPEHAIAHIEESIENLVPGENLRWYAVKLFERDRRVYDLLNLPADLLAHIEGHIKDCEKEMDDDSESIITNQRYEYIAKLSKTCWVKREREGGTLSDKVDRIVTNRVLALPIFAAVMYCVYYIAITTIGTWVTDYTNDVIVGGWAQGGAAALLEKWGVSGWLSSLIVDGIIGGVGAVIGFVPQMIVLFLMLAALEDVGYMARVAFIMDRIFRRFGLSGKSFIPMLIASGCGVPGVMATRTIENERDRRMTIMTTTFIPCGAKMPIIALIAGAIFPGQSWVAPSAYFLGVAAVIVSGIILKKTRPFQGDPAPFVMELPPYHIPSLTNVLRSTWERGSSFIKRAGSIILLSSILIWFVSSFSLAGGLHMVEDMNESMLASIGSAIAPLFAPLGFGTWPSVVATVMGLVAKEEVVAVFGVLYGVAGDAMEMVDAGEFEGLAPIAQHFTRLSAFSFMAFNLLCAPCFAAVGAIRREMNNGKWTLFAFTYMCCFAYYVAFMIFQLGSWAEGNGFTYLTAIACGMAALMLWALFRPEPEDGGELIDTARQRA